MRNAKYQIIPWMIVLLPFLLLAFSYGSLSSQILIARNIDGSGAVYAPRSAFVVFRVPLMELVCALAIEIMRRPFARDAVHRNYYLMWTALLYTVGFKSLFQSLEIVFSTLSNVYFYLTASVVVLGIVVASVPGIKAFSGFSRKDRLFTILQISALLGLLLAYIVLAFVL